MSERSLGTRVQRRENDVASIYDILTDVQEHLGRHDDRFDGIDAQLTGLDAQMATVVDLLREHPR